MTGQDLCDLVLSPFCTSSSGYGHKSATHLLDAEEVPAQGFGMSELIEPQQLLERIGLISETALAAMIGVEIKEEFCAGIPWCNRSGAPSETDGHQEAAQIPLRPTVKMS